MNLNTGIETENDQQLSATNSYLTCCQKLVARLDNAKAGIVNEFRDKLADYSHLLELAVNEAEALAWETDFPELLFPSLALEKANNVAAWNSRQQAIRQSTAAKLALAA